MSRATGRMISDSVIVLTGPAVEVEFQNGAVIEAAYLMSLSITNSMTPVLPLRSPQGYRTGDRQMVQSLWGFFMGYRNSSFKEQEGGAKEFSYGLTYSLRGSVPFRGTSSLYGNLTYLSIMSRLKARRARRPLVGSPRSAQDRLHQTICDEAGL